MPHLKQRVLQVGATILAVSMLGGYVVYSQKSQQSGQMMPGSKTKQLSSGAGQPAPTSHASASGVLSTNAPQLMMSSTKGGVFVTSSQPAQAPGLSAQTAPGVVWVPATNHSLVFMSSSKFVTVVRPEALRTAPTNGSASNPPSRMLMPGSKSFIMPAPVSSGSTPAVTTNHAPATR